MRRSRSRRGRRRLRGGACRPDGESLEDRLHELCGRFDLRSDGKATCTQYNMHTMQHAHDATCSATRHCNMQRNSTMQHAVQHRDCESIPIGTSGCSATSLSRYYYSPASHSGARHVLRCPPAGLKPGPCGPCAGRAACARAPPPRPSTTRRLQCKKRIRSRAVRLHTVGALSCRLVRRPARRGWRGGSVRASATAGGCVVCFGGMHRLEDALGQQKRRAGTQAVAHAIGLLRVEIVKRDPLRLLRPQPQSARAGLCRCQCRCSIRRSGGVHGSVGR
jgi:hypothetical protein